MGLERVGVMTDDNTLADVNIAYAAYLHNKGNARAYKIADALTPTSMLEMIEGGDVSLTAIREALQVLQLKPGLRGPRGEQIMFSLSEVRLKAPVPRPPKILGPNFNQKNDQARIRRPPGELRPFYAIKLGTCVTGPFDPIVIPQNIGTVASEVEAVAIIGRKGEKIPVEKAEKYIFGYSIINDVTANEMRDKTEWVVVKKPGGEEVTLSTAARYKCFDTFCPMGPWIVTKDAIDIHHCHMESRINGELDQTGTTADLVFNLFQLVACFSETHTLEPGDVISTGTVPLAPERKKNSLGKIDLSTMNGVLESEIQGIGTLKNPIEHV
jgi:2-keto-4-pentenoate hydratase/2-oxohepta-3-ene-1,7-dioic acid hydratase in catechol pathway